MNVISRFFKDTSGSTVIEYGLIAALIAMALLAITQGLSALLITSSQTKEIGMENPFS